MKRLPTALLVVALLVGAAGCGQSQRKESKVFFAWPDVTDSTYSSRTSYLSDMISFTQLAAAEHGMFYAAPFTGSPQTSTDYPVQFNFGTTPKALAGNRALQSAFLDSKVKALSPQLQNLLKANAVRPGTPLLTVLAVTANTVASYSHGVQGCVGVFTDGGVIEPGLNVYQRLTTVQRTALIQTWKPRLKALRGADVFVVGVGYGTNISIGDLNYLRSVLTQLMGAVGAKLTTFDERLPENAHC